MNRNVFDCSILVFYFCVSVLFNNVYFSKHRIKYYRTKHKVDTKAALY